MEVLLVFVFLYLMNGIFIISKYYPEYMKKIEYQTVKGEKKYNVILRQAGIKKGKGDFIIAFVIISVYGIFSILAWPAVLSYKTLKMIDKKTGCFRCR